MRAVVFPLVLFVLTFPLVPYVTRKWQDREKGIDLRTALADEMSRSFSNAIVSARLAATGAVYTAAQTGPANVAATQNAFNAGLRQWLIDAEAIKSALRARFRDERIGQSWTRYTTGVVAYYRLGGRPGDPKTEIARVRRLVTAYPGPAINWNLVAEHPRRRSTAAAPGPKVLAFRASYVLLGERLMRVGEGLVERVVSLKPTV